MSYENYISYRYLIASKGKFLTFLNFISIAGVAIGVTALIVVTGVMTGFGNNLREKIIGTTPHVMIEKETGVEKYEDLKKQIMGLEDVKGASAYIQGNIFLENEGQAMGLAIRGIQPESESQVTKVKEYLIKGDLAALQNDGVIVGSELARFFGYKLGDTITLISPGSGMAGEKWRYQLTIIGIFTSGMVDFDMNLIIVNLKKAQEIFHMPGDVATGLGVKLKDPYKAKEAREEIHNMIGFGYAVRTWIDINRNLFEALFLEKWGLFIVLTMMVLIASFNIISTLIVTVTTKIHDIGILQSIGVPKKSIRWIFTKQGFYIGLLGTFWGFVGGLSLAYILRHYVKVPADIYSIDHVPVEINPVDVGAILLAALVISYLATIYPASKAATLQPVEALRYE